MTNDWPEDPFRSPGRYLLNTKEAAALLGLSRSGLYGLIYAGYIQPLRIGRMLRFLPEDLKAFIARRAMRPPKKVRVKKRKLLKAKKKRR